MRAWISGSGSVPGSGSTHRAAEVEVVVRELEVEERRLRLLELRRRRQHVVGELRGLGHGDVDDDDELERVERLAHARPVGERVGRVGRLDEHRPVAVGVIGEDLLGDHVARHEPGDDPRVRRPASAAHRTTVDAEPPPPTRFTMLVGTYWPPGLAKLPVSSHSSFSR